MALGGGRGELVDGEGAAPQLVLGWGVDTEWFSSGLRFRGARADASAAEQRAPRTHWELGLGLTLERFVDLSWGSVAFGLLLEGAWHHQAFDAASRDGFSAAFGALISAEREIATGLSIRIEGGPLATVVERSDVERGAEIGRETQSAVTAWGAAGLKWRL